MNILGFLSFFLTCSFARRKDYSPRALQDSITTLPGLSSNDLAKYSMFSGYITVNESHGRNIFYWFVESLNDPTSDPVALWTNGGPGCSGLGGFFTEQGPFRVTEDYSLYINNHSWVNVANMIFIEQPSGVGFSYSDTPSDYSTDDSKAANDNYEFIKEWLTLFPNYQSNDFYITSESYGGHYMPTLAKTIVEGNTAGGSPQVNFKGLFVGNPYTDPVENAKGQYDTWYGHQLTSLPTYLKYVDACDDGEKFGVECDIAKGEMSEEVGNVDPYALDFPVCTRNLSMPHSSYFDFITYGEKFWFIKKVLHEGLHQPIPKMYKNMIAEFDEQIALVHKSEEEYVKHFESWLESQMYNSHSDSKKLLGSTSDFPPDNYHACESNWMTVYLNRKDVQNAIHALNTTYWTMCSYTLDYNMTDSEHRMEPYYDWLVSNDPTLHITVVSGDDDSVCGTLGTQYWIWNMGWTVDSSYDWNAWYLDDQVSGYHTRWTNGVNFVTVHSAGHMIPETQPKRSLTAFTNYLAGTF